MISYEIPYLWSVCELAKSGSCNRAYLFICSFPIFLFSHIQLPSKTYKKQFYKFRTEKLRMIRVMTAKSFFSANIPKEELELTRGVYKDNPALLKKCLK